eukprot:TRINITY_DN95877_c0_g1_i1.p2 TRINITY_DN95877_c0_g1~~TRINITY_DN95877_c0_g1_i1.p2  ORF type:complete len:318 (+),score=167.99 TRINITY_DN95877_c0_g1_i1:49-1002(+)
MLRSLLSRRVLAGAAVTSAALGVSASLYKRSSTSSASPSSSPWSVWGALAENAKAKQPPSMLHPKKFVDLKLVDRTDVNHNSILLRFRPVDEEDGSVLDMSFASFILVKAPFKDEKGKPVVRPYTPVGSNGTNNMELLVKVYPNGKVGPYLKSLSIGDTVKVKGPLPKIKYEANMKKSLSLIAGGSGLTPMFQIMHAVLTNPEDTTKLHFVFANVAEEDILLRPVLDLMQRQWPEQLQVHYVLEKAPENWHGETGYVDADKIRRLLPPPSDDNMVLVCGPPPMLKAIAGPKAPDYSQGEVGGALKTLGFKESQVFKF